ncbi:restriction endonuclease subunit S [Runella sp.]|uniref:restriction endonuclease subunit S n=1 Tax=Runella sp. TaxID=1960881 RepID=UPI00301A8D15
MTTQIPKLRFLEFEGEWEKKKLGEVTNYTKGFAFKSEDYTNEGKRIIRVSDLGSDSIKNNYEKIFIDEDKIKELGKYKILKGEIIITTVGSKPEMIESAVGRGILISNSELGYLNQNLLKINVSNEIDNRFIFGLLKSKEYETHIKQIQRGNANQSNITVSDLFEFKIYLPTLPEQTKIANFLTAIDTKIQQLTQKKALLEEYKKGVMQQLFSGTSARQPIRFKDENGADYPDWEVKKLGEVGKFVGGGTPSTQNKEFWQGDIPWISSSDLSDDSIFKINITRFITQEAIQSSPVKLIPPNSILIVSRVGVGKVAINEKALCTSQDFASLIASTSEYYSLFLAYLIKFQTGKLLGFNQGTSIKGFVKSDLENLEVSIPCYNEQLKIANYFFALDTKIQTVAKQIGQTQAYKKGLLQQLFV